MVIVECPYCEMVQEIVYNGILHQVMKRGWIEHTCPECDKPYIIKMGPVSVLSEAIPGVKK